ncbi:MAG: hypothetical protein D3923_18355, partial [Candidatus Electrothrix sp. AR3]|nr:hypothetical protein [Candidatus Electrothrix sp. AR3]
MFFSNIAPSQKGRIDLRRQLAGLIILTILTALVYNYFFLNRAYVEIDCTADHATSIEVIWAHAGEQYSRENMGMGRINKGDTRIGFFIGDLRKIRHLRLDPMGRQAGTVTFRTIKITQPGMPPLIFADEADFARFTPGTDISSFSFSLAQGWSVQSGGGNPNMHIVLDPPAARALNLFSEGSRFLGCLFLLFLLLKAFAPLVDNFSYVPVLATGIVLLTLAMALTTQYGKHPDESVHAAAAYYYENHWLMPDVESPEIASTYSVYGFSRLNSKEISYIIAGKFARL